MNAQNMNPQKNESSKYVYILAGILTIHPAEDACFEHFFPQKISDVVLYT
jgi:hypothetical protein